MSTRLTCSPPAAYEPRAVPAPPTVNVAGPPPYVPSRDRAGAFVSAPPASRAALPYAFSGSPPVRRTTVTTRVIPARPQATARTRLLLPRDGGSGRPPGPSIASATPGLTGSKLTVPPWIRSMSR